MQNGHPLVLHLTTVPITFKFLAGQTQFMRERGFEVVGITSGGAFLKEAERISDCEIHVVEMTRSMTPLDDLIALMRIVRVIRNLQPDIVHGHTPKAGLLGMLAAYLVGGSKRIYTFHGLPMITARGFRRFLLKVCDKIACSLSHDVIAVSNSLRCYVHKAGIFPKSKIHVVNKGSANGVDYMKAFNPENVAKAAVLTFREEHRIPFDAIVIGYVGRIVRDKGVIELLNAWERLAARFPNAFLLIVGAEEKRDSIPKDEAARLRKHSRVRFTGEIRNMPIAYSAMNILVLPSYREGLPNVLLEAAAMGLPRVTTNAVGCVDSVDPGRNGLMVKVGDELGLERAIESYICDPSLRRIHGDEARRWVGTHFDQSLIWEGILRRYQRLLGLEPEAGTALRK